MSIFPNSAKSFITREGSVPSKNLFKSIFGEIIFIIKFIGVFAILLCLFKINSPKIRFDTIKVTAKKITDNLALDDSSKKMTAGNKKIVMTSKFNEYVPTYDKICSARKLSNNTKSE